MAFHLLPNTVISNISFPLWVFQWSVGVESPCIIDVSSLPPPHLVIKFFEGSRPDHTKSWLYGVCSLSYLGAMVSSNSALQYVNYPTQVSLIPQPIQCLAVIIIICCDILLF